jgi:flagellar assembly protein FliH
MEQGNPIKSLSSYAEKTSKPRNRSAGFDSADWEVVGELNARPRFQRQKLEVIQNAEIAGDPLFKTFDASKKRSKLGDNPAQEAQQKSEPMITVKEAARLIAEAEAKGKAAAAEEAKNIRDSELKNLENRMTGIFQSLQEFSTKQISEVEKFSLEVALKLSKKIIDQAVEINPEYIVTILQEALKYAGTAAIKKVRVSSQDFEFVEVMGLSKKLKEFDGTWAFEADDNLKSGCVIETSAGEVDFNLEKSWERIAESVVRMIK